MTSFLRRRVLGDDKVKKEVEDDSLKAEEVRLAPVSQIVSKNDKKTRKRRTGLIFGLGGLFGLVIAGIFAGKSDYVDFPEISGLDSILDVLPAGLVKEAQALTVRWQCDRLRRVMTD